MHRLEDKYCKAKVSVLITLKASLPANKRLTGKIINSENR